MKSAPGKFHKTLARNIRKLRGEDTQQKFAKRVGVSHATINRIEQQKQNVTLNLLESFCRALKKSATELLEQTED